VLSDDQTTITVYLSSSDNKWNGYLWERDTDMMQCIILMEMYESHWILYQLHLIKQAGIFICNIYCAVLWVYQVSLCNNYSLTHAAGTHDKQTSCSIGRKDMQDGCAHKPSCKENITKIIIPHGCGKPISKIYLPICLYETNIGWHLDKSEVSD